MNLSAEQICIISLIVLALIIVILNDRIKERLVRRSERRKEKPPREHLNYRTSWWLVVTLAVSVVLFAAFAGKPPPWLRATAIAATVTGFAILLISVIVVRKKQGVLRTANAMARQGDVEGAIAFLEEHMQHNGPSAPVYNHLALLRGLQGRWAESLRLIEEAEQQAGAKPETLANKGVALWKLGRPQEALPFLQEAARRLRHNLTTICTYGSVLAELQRTEEALEQLRRADQLFASEWAFAVADDRREAEEVLESLRGLVSRNSGK